MKRITKIRIPKKYCGKCKFYAEGFWNWEDECNLFGERLEDVETDDSRCDKCLKMFPNGAVFELKEKK